MRQNAEMEGSIVRGRKYFVQMFEALGHFADVRMEAPVNWVCNWLLFALPGFSQ